MIMDKEQVIQQIQQMYQEHLINGYSVVAYAGDGAFDAPGAKQADLKFAKRRLAEILEKENIPYYKLSEFKVIQNCLEEKNIL